MAQGQDRARENWKKVAFKVKALNALGAFRRDISITEAEIAELSRVLQPVIAEQRANMSPEDIIEILISILRDDLNAGTNEVCTSIANKMMADFAAATPAVAAAAEDSEEVEFTVEAADSIGEHTPHVVPAAAPAVPPLVRAAVDHGHGDIAIAAAAARATAPHGQLRREDAVVIGGDAAAAPALSCGARLAACWANFRGRAPAAAADNGRL